MRRTATALVGLLVLVAGCGGADSGEGAGADEPAAPTSSAEPGPLAEPITEREGCAELMPAGAFEETTIESPDGDVLRAAEFPAQDPPVALVLLHQTNPEALCGWGPFAAAAIEEGLPSVAFDLCGYGDSECSERLEGDPAAQVDLAVDRARESFGADRVVVVGASMGGANAVLATADGADVAGWVDVSGPNGWFVGRPLVDVAPQLRGGPPGLVVFSRSEGDTAFGEARLIARQSGAGFVAAPPGHGWELLNDEDDALTDVGREVLAFAAGVG